MATANQIKEAKARAVKAAAKAAADAAGGENKTGATKIIQVPALSVIASRAGFRRGGFAWGKEATVVKLSELSDEQIELIKGEGLLSVTEVEVDEEVAE